MHYVRSQKEQRPPDFSPLQSPYLGLPVDEVQPHESDLRCHGEAVIHVIHVVFSRQTAETACLRNCVVQPGSSSWTEEKLHSWNITHILKLPCISPQIFFPYSPNKHTVFARVFITLILCMNPDFTIKHLYSVFKCISHITSVYAAVISESVHYFSEKDTALSSTWYATELLSNDVATGIHGSQYKMDKYRNCLV